MDNIRDKIAGIIETVMKYEHLTPDEVADQILAIKVVIKEGGTPCQHLDHAGDCSSIDDCEKTFEQCIPPNVTATIGDMIEGEKVREDGHLCRPSDTIAVQRFGPATSRDIADQILALPRGEGWYYTATERLHIRPIEYAEIISEEVPDGTQNEKRIYPISPDKLIETYVYRDDLGWNVSTINRDSSSMFRGQYAETIVWEFSKTTRKRGEIVYMDADLTDSIDTHIRICQLLYTKGICDVP